MLASPGRGRLGRPAWPVPIWRQSVLPLADTRAGGAAAGYHLQSEQAKRDAVSRIGLRCPVVLTDTGARLLTDLSKVALIGTTA
jgi:hypothetical protein